MTREEALRVLSEIPSADCAKPWRANPVLTVEQAKVVMVNSISGWPEGATLTRLFEKRVYQVSKNQKEPRFK